MYIQGDAPSVITPIFPFNNEFIQIQILDFFKFTYYDYIFNSFDFYTI